MAEKFLIFCLEEKKKERKRIAAAMMPPTEANKAFWGCFAGNWSFSDRGVSLAAD